MGVDKLPSAVDYYEVIIEPWPHTPFLFAATRPRRIFMALHRWADHHGFTGDPDVRVTRITRLSRKPSGGELDNVEHS